MSRIGKLPLKFPPGVTVKIEGRRVRISGPKGMLEMDVHPSIALDVAGDELRVVRRSDARSTRALHGLTRALLGNMVKGVTEGFEKQLSVTGIGYKAQVKGNHLLLSVGHSHPIEYPIPEEVKVEVEGQTNIRIFGIDKQKVGQVAAEIRNFRPVEPYKGKGIRYIDEKVRRKEGKAAS